MGEKVVWSPSCWKIFFCVPQKKKYTYKFGVTWRRLNHCRTFTSSLIFLIRLMVVRAMIRILSSVAVGRLMLTATRAAIEREKIREECIFLQKNKSYCHMSCLIVCGIKVSKCLKNVCLHIQKQTNKQKLKYSCPVKYSTTMN